MSTITTTDLAQAVEDAAAHLYVWALKDIPQDLRDALAAARERETSVTGIRVLETIHRNVEIADEEKKRTYIEKYLPHVAEALRDILALSERQTKSIVTSLADVLERTRKL